MKTLMHICCAPCSVYCIESLRAEGIEPVGFWYNPTIHPYTEYRSRRDCLRDYAQQVNLTLIEQDEYGLRDFVRRVADHIEGRCADCYAIRLEQTAAYAAAHGYDSFTTTLLVSPYQKHELIRQIGERLAERVPASSSSTGISVWASGKARKRPGKPDSICRNTAAASSVRRTAIYATAR